MTLRRTFRAGFLWLSLLLPLQSFAAIPCGSGAPAVHAAHPHCAHDSAALHQHGDHGCGKSCCGAAIALTSVHGVAAPPAAADIFSAVTGGPLLIARDRLDRPPRFIPA